MKESTLSTEIEAFIETKKNQRTKNMYHLAFGHFMDFYRGKRGEDASAKGFIKESYLDLERPLGERTHFTESVLNEFIKYLQVQGKSNNSIRTYIAAVRSFLRYHDVPIRMKFVGLPVAKVKEENHKHRWKVEEVKRFVDSATTYRDKALILCMYQSGLAVNELINLDYGHVRGSLESGEIPIMLRLTREKTNTPFVTFFGRDSAKYLKLYLATRNNLKDDSPLFSKQGTEERLTAGAIDFKFREIAEGLGYIDEESNGYNPVRPHSLRAAFNSRLMGKIDGTLREFWMGHSISKVAKAYLALPAEEMRELYMDAEKWLTIEKTSRDELIEQRTFKAEARQEIIGLKTAVDGLAKRYSDRENKEIQKLKHELESLREENLKLKKQVASVEEGEKRLEMLYWNLDGFVRGKKEP